MNKIKEIWEKYKKIIIIVLFLLLLILLLLFTKGFGLFQSKGLDSKIGKYDLNEMDDFSYVWDFEDEKVLKIYGIVSDLNDGSSSFILKSAEGQGYQTIVYFIDPTNQEQLVDIGKISTGNYVVVEGKWSVSYSSVIAEKITAISEDFVKDFIASKIPMLEIEVLDSPEDILHTCETVKFKIRITNNGKIPISHADLYSREYGYGMYYFIDEDSFISNSDREDYAQVFEELDDKEEIGLLSNLGFLYFDDIGPGESLETEYWGGGKVTASYYSDLFDDDGSNRMAGISGEHNIFSRKGSGIHSFSFGWAKKSYDSPEFLSKSNVVSINLVEDECYASEENITDSYIIE
jgi:hypothetical protein